MKQIITYFANILVFGSIIESDVAYTFKMMEITPSWYHVKPKL